MVYEEPPIPAPSTAAVAPEELSYVDDLPEPEELMDVSPEESATLQGDSADEPADEVPSPWAQPTIEVPLEMRAQASVESAQPPADATFDEVFEEDEPASAPAPPSAPEHAHSPAPAHEAPEAHFGAATDDFGYVGTPDVTGSPAAPSAASAVAPETAKEGFGTARSGARARRESPSFTGMGESEEESPGRRPSPCAGLRALSARHVRWSPRLPVAPESAAEPPTPSRPRRSGVPSTWSRRSRSGGGPDLGR
jgi:hypothetical protein